ncbi:response regulator transcription factor [Bradyrhizobium sp. S3.9.1]|uniref:response regulator transcription factor n=1 Tax=Bradyrhizobium sp. S3.9.1 TaxID=3156431 RepID=UPI003392F1B9
MSYSDGLIELIDKSVRTNSNITVRNAIGRAEFNRRFSMLCCEAKRRKPMRRIRLVIADRRPIVLQGFASLLEAQPDFDVVACCLDGASCLAAIRSLMPDVVLLEDGFTDVTASDILAVVDREGHSSRLIFFTATVACGDLARALATGACGAISMNAKPEALVQSLRLEKPGSDLARVGNEANGIASFGNNVLAVLTVNERTIMDLVAEGLSDSEIARVLGVALEIVKTHIDHARQKLGINSRTELAALAASRRYGAMSILAAAILAALDDSSGHAATESFTVMAANGCAEVVTIKINRKEAVSGTPAKGASKDRAGGATGTSSPTGKLVDPLAEIAASLFAPATLDALRPGSSSYSIFMVAAFAALIYELDGANHAAQAFDFGGEIVTSSTASDARGLTSALPGSASFDGTAIDEAFAFEFAQGDTIATEGRELYVVNALAEHGGSDREMTISRGAATVDVVAAAAHEASHGDPTQTGSDEGSNRGRSQSDLRRSDNSSEAAKREAPGDDSNRGQSQKALHESDNGAAEGHAKHTVTGDLSNHGQLQKALHESDNSSGAAKGHDKHAVAGDLSNHGQSQKALHGSDSGSAAGKQHAQHSQAGDFGIGKPQQDIPTASVNSVSDTHSALKIKTEGNGGPPSDNAGQSKSAAGTELGDSFHFKNGADYTSSDILNPRQFQGNGKAGGDGQHTEGPVSVYSADQNDISDAHFDHSGHANLHAAHDLIV